MKVFAQLYVAFIFVGLMVMVIAASIAWLNRPPIDDFREDVTHLATAWADSLSPDPIERQVQIHHLAERLGGDVSLWDRRGQVLLTTGRVPFGPEGHYFGPLGRGMRVPLPDGRMVGFRAVPPAGRVPRLLGLLAILALTVAIGCYPLARSFSSRLERLREGATVWGEGDLTSRIEVSGKDEIAQVALAFNQAAEKVQDLMSSQQRVLASVSHELRSPLARLRLHLEMMPESSQVQQAIEEVQVLDDTVGDVLRIARMVTQNQPQDPTEVHLFELANEFASELVTISGEHLTVLGDERLLRHMVRNAVENAQRHGEPPVRITLTPQGLIIADSGPGVPPELREKVFEPFFQTDSRNPGVGLGLALIRQIAEFHGGEAQFTNAPHGELKITLHPRTETQPA